MSITAKVEVSRAGKVFLKVANLSRNLLTHRDVYVNIDVTMETEFWQSCFLNLHFLWKIGFISIFSNCIIILYMLLITFYWQLRGTSSRRVVPKIGCAGFDLWKSLFFFFHNLAPSMKMILPSGQDFHKKKKKNTFQNSIKRYVCRFQKCLAYRALKEAKGGNSTMFCGRLFHSFIVLGKNENL